MEVIDAEVPAREGTGIALENASEPLSAICAPGAVLPLERRT